MASSHRPPLTSELIFPLHEQQLQLIDDETLKHHLEAQLLPVSGLIYPKIADTSNSMALMSAELETPVLDELNEYLHFIAPRDYRRVHPLHEHLIRKRQIVVTENPGLHLIWHYNTIFVKPIPPFLLNFTMWRRCLLPPVETVDESTQQSSYPISYPICALQSPCKSALGFLRTYELLVRHPSDFNIAQTMNLIPQNISYFEFRAFIGPFHSLPHSAVAQRYHFGQMRLTRLNWAVRLLQPRMVRTGGWLANRLYYQELSTQSSDYILGLVAPVLFIFGLLSVMLSAMQVMLTAFGMPNAHNMIVQVSSGFSIAIIIFCIMLGGVIMMVLLVLLIGQYLYALKASKR